MLSGNMMLEGRAKEPDQLCGQSGRQTEWTIQLAFSQQLSLLFFLSGKMTWVQTAGPVQQLSLNLLQIIFYNRPGWNHQDGEKGNGLDSGILKQWTAMEIKAKSITTLLLAFSLFFQSPEHTSLMTPSLQRPYNFKVWAKVSTPSSFLISQWYLGGLVDNCGTPVCSCRLALWSST